MLPKAEYIRSVGRKRGASSSCASEDDEEDCTQDSDDDDLMQAAPPPRVLRPTPRASRRPGLRSASSVSAANGSFSYFESEQDADDGEDGDDAPVMPPTRKRPRRTVAAPSSEAQLAFAAALYDALSCVPKCVPGAEEQRGVMATMRGWIHTYAPHNDDGDGSIAHWPMPSISEGLSFDL